MVEPFSTVAGAIGVADVALSSIKQLYDLLESIRGAHQAINATQQELDVVQETLASLKSALDTRSAAEINIAAFETVVRSCADDCDQFRQRLVSWTSHSSEEKISLRDRVQVGFLSQRKITAFIRRLKNRKQTIMFVLACDTFAQSIDLKEREGRIESDLVFREQEVANQASNTMQRIAAVEHSLRQLSEEEHDSHTDISDVHDLQEESRVLQTYRDICRQEISRLQGWRKEQNITGVNMDHNSGVAAGIMNSASNDSQVKQNISQVSASGGSKGIIGIADKVNFDDFFK
ncbi:MAG: hypothetical protein M1831_004496 [Alyxoria varia]|nr:MAG: hypothetical protein M1831_004496 [Alyxoria varia]